LIPGLSTSRKAQPPGYTWDSRTDTGESRSRELGGILQNSRPV